MNTCLIKDEEYETLNAYLDEDEKKVKGILRGCIKPLMMRQDYGSSSDNFIKFVKNIIKEKLPQYKELCNNLITSATLFISYYLRSRLPTTILLKITKAIAKLYNKYGLSIPLRDSYGTINMYFVNRPIKKITYNMSLLTGEKQIQKKVQIYTGQT